MYLPKKWDVNKYDQSLVEKISSELKIMKITAEVLMSKGISSVEKAEFFLNPGLNMLYDPFLLPDMKKAVDRIRKAIAGKEKILVYGDRDVDGITAVVIMLETLKELGADCMYFVPMEEAYSVQKEIIDRYRKQGVSLIITVDCGIKSIEEVEYAGSLGIDIIITDHHEAMEELPNAVALVNPKIKSSNYPFREIAGCTVAFKACLALYRSFAEPGKTENDKLFINRYLDLMALGSIADIVPLIDENRVIVKNGLYYLMNTKRIGLRLLMEYCMKQSDFTKLTASDISWKIVPPLNASGRMGNASVSCELMLTENTAEAEELLKEIMTLNSRRKSSQEKSLEIVNSIIHEQCNILEDKIFVISSHEIDKRIAGIIASHIMQEYYRPVIVLREEGDEVVGSARSVETFNIENALQSCGDLLTRYGGHKFAAGLSMKKDNVNEFRKRIGDYANDKLTEEDLIPRVMIDHILDASQVTDSLMEEVNSMEPFGYFNSSPVFAIYGAMLDRNMVGWKNGNNLRIRLKDNNLEGFGWGLGVLSKELQKVSKVDIVFNLVTNYWDGKKYLRLLIKDIRPDS